MKIVVWGTGKRFENNIERITKDAEVIALFDNDEKKWGKSINGIKVYSPAQINDFDFDYVLILCVNELEIREQLLSLNVDSQKILLWEKYRSKISEGVLDVHVKNWNVCSTKKKVLIITTDMNYNGGTLAAIYAYDALVSLGYSVCIAAPSCDKKFMDEMLLKGVNIIITQSLNYIGKKDRTWVDYFDIVIVNVFQMIECACGISAYKPVMWWIHEGSHLYSNIYLDSLIRHDDVAKKENFEDVNIFAVSNIAKRNFNYFFHDGCKKTLAYGIPDTNKNVPAERSLNRSLNCEEKIIFAVVGSFMELKNQKVFCEAVCLMEERLKNKAEFWLAGYIGNDQYALEVRELAEREQCIKIKGLLSRSEMEELYDMIDVVVCPSVEETMSIVITEGMMYGKICLCTKNAGMAEYIEDGINGIICESTDESYLAEKISWIIEEYENLGKMRENARKTYENVFSIPIFANRLEKNMLETIEMWERRKNDK